MSATDPDARLLDHLEAGLHTDTTDQAFQVVDVASADWCARKAARARSEFDEVQRIAAEQVDRIREWESEEYARLSGRWRWFEELVTAWHAEQVHRQQAEGVPDRSLRKTITLPSGAQLRRRAQPDRIQVGDTEALKKQYPDLVTTVVKANLYAIRRHLKQTGEIPNGCAVSAQDPKYTVAHTDAAGGDQ